MKVTNKTRYFVFSDSLWKCEDDKRFYYYAPSLNKWRRTSGITTGLTIAILEQSKGVREVTVEELALIGFPPYN